MRPLSCIARSVPRAPRLARYSSKAQEPSLDGLFQSPKLKTSPVNSLAFAREVRKRVGEYRTRQAGLGRHPLAPVEKPEGEAFAVIQGEQASVQLYGKHLVVKSYHAPDLSVSYAFLRDVCPCPACVQPSTRQKLFKAGQAFEELSAGPPKPSDVRLTGSNLIIQWPSHQSTYPLAWLRPIIDASAIPVEQTPQIYTPIEWPDKAGLLASPTLRIPYEAFRFSATHQHALLSQLVGYGLVILTGVPTQHTTDADCELRKAMGVLGELRNTFYGTTWDVKALPDSRNIAYTDVDLGFHQDLWYDPLTACGGES